MPFGEPVAPSHRARGEHFRIQTNGRAATRPVSIDVVDVARLRGRRPTSRHPRRHIGVDSGDDIAPVPRYLAPLMVRHAELRGAVRGNHCTDNDQDWNALQPVHTQRRGNERAKANGTDRTVLLVAFAALAGADQWSDKTTLKSDSANHIPGATVAPGTYTFQLLDTKANREVVQIFNEDGTRLSRHDSGDSDQANGRDRGRGGQAESDRSPGAPAALKAWFYPGLL